MGYMRPETNDWLCDLQRELIISEKFEAAAIVGWKSYRSSMGRNRAIKEAIDSKCDYLLSVDPDMVPDVYVGHHEKAKKFFPSSLAWLESHPGGVVGAPAVGGRPKRRPNIYGVNTEGGLRELTHEECRAAVANPRVERVPCVGSGLLLIDMKLFRKFKPPWFCDTYWDDTQSELKLGQDMYFTGHATKTGAEVWCNWFSWAGHVKAETLVCPGLELEGETNARIR